MLVKVKKFLIYGYHKDKKQFFEQAHQHGFIEFIHRSGKTPKANSDAIRTYGHAIKILQANQPAEQSSERSYEPLELANKIIDLQNSIDSHEDSIRMLNLEYERLLSFGDFSLEDIHDLEKKTGRVVQFFYAKRTHKPNLSKHSNLIFINEHEGLHYYLSIAKRRAQPSHMVEIKPLRDLAQIRKQKMVYQTKLESLKKKLLLLRPFKQLLIHALTNEINSTNQDNAIKTAASHEKHSIFTVEAWIPLSKVDTMKSVLASLSINYEEIQIERTDREPTYMENNGTARMGEDLVNIYDTPSPLDRDPSTWVFASFLLFFAMIVGDGGYGLLLLLISFFIQKKLAPLSKSHLRVLRMVQFLSSACIIWGVATHSFFGIQFAPDSSFKALSLKQRLVEKKVAYHWQQKDSVYQEWTQRFGQLTNLDSPQSIIKEASIETNSTINFPLQDKFSDYLMLEISLLVGCIHVIIALFRYLPRTWSHAGWILLIIGGYLYVPYYLDSTSLLHILTYADKVTCAEVGLMLIPAGLIAAVAGAIFQQGLLGLLEITNVIQIFGDVLSYLRLYALSLAGGIVSQLVNEMAGSVFIVLAIIALVLGHGVNIILSLMGGVIHGLRLNFIEWYHYCFDGGGKAFTPLKLLEKN